MYRANQQQTGQGQGPGAQTSRPAEPQISNIGALPFPLEAILDETGEQVTLLQTCDWAGHSPSNIGVDRNGKQFISAFNESTVVDHRVLPNPQSAQVRQRRERQTVNQ